MDTTPRPRSDVISALSRRGTHRRITRAGVNGQATGRIENQPASAGITLRRVRTFHDGSDKIRTGVSNRDSSRRPARVTVLGGALEGASRRFRTFDGKGECHG
jgi:hypothetical protein